MKIADELISVVVPVYNVIDYLDECINSILSQSYQKIEVILIDDGSTDGCSRKCDEYKNNKIRVIHQKNAGLSAARNKGLSVAKGKYICFIDSDDYILPNYLEKLYGAIVNNNSDISVCGFNDTIPEADSMDGEKATINLLIKQENIDILAWNKLYKRSLFVDNDITYPEKKIHEDNLTTYKLYSHSRRVSYINESLYYYRTRNSSITKQSKEIEHLHMRELAAKEAQKYLHDNQKLKSAADISLLTAKLAYIDKSLSEKIEKTNYTSARDWIISNKDSYKDNEFLSLKLKTYIKLLSMMGGKPYSLFRKIKHQ